MVGGGLGIGQEKLLVTPLQIATSTSIVANKGYYYVPHFVQKIDGESAEDTTLNKFRVKHEVLSHIPDEVFDVVIEGMHDVTIVGTAKGIPKIPDVNVCAKTGTAENKRVLDGRTIQLKDHSVFVCFAPMEDPKIVVAVIVENGGFGAAWAGPMAYLLTEKYLKDTLRAERLKDVDRIAAANLMPSYLPRLQFREDSVRAAAWAKLTGDSTRWFKYMTPSFRMQMMDSSRRHNAPPAETEKTQAIKPKNTVKPHRPDSVR
jgi:penicillin-binding protein 2